VGREANGEVISGGATIATASSSSLSGSVIMARFLGVLKILSLDMLVLEKLIIFESEVIRFVRTEVNYFCTKFTNGVYIIVYSHAESQRNI
jgi:hypothetical protein